MKKRAVDRTPPKVEELPEFVTVNEYAAVARIGLTTAYELVRSGEIASMRFGRVIRIPRRVLEELVNGSDASMEKAK